MLGDFRKFVMRGNVLDMAVGIIIGAAFGKIVSSFVGDVLMPPIGLLLGGIDFADFFINLSGGDYQTLAAAKEAGAVTINYGAFLNLVLDFLIVALAVFLLVRAVERMKKQEAPAEPTTKKCNECLSEIPKAARRCAFCTSPAPA
ncbi:MAG TPA: large-conductance mechanosensitive channel protein MscL [Myxococcota bacterium]|nr:large-conductance mechanosensitive channel protein MscL [Myxococcota bacterium]